MARILVVDDDALDRMIIGSVLVQEGHEPVYAPEGESALALYKEEAFDLVLTDVVMPKHNGLRLIREIISLDPDASIVAITGRSPEQLVLAEDYGAVGTLIKPIDRDQLLGTVEDALGA